jgi:tripartite-type tricarboxylate transporter receptor subunit TctC
MSNPVTAALAALCMIIGTGSASAQTASSYPAKPVRMISPYDPGGQSDTLIRAIGQKLTEKWGQPIVVENRPGAGGNIGTEYTARQAPDGYTMVVAEGFVFTVNPLVFKNLTWDPIRDFAPVTRLNHYASVLVVHPSVPANNLKEFLALARAKPGVLNYGSFGIGSGGHINFEALKLATKIDIVPVHYKGSAGVVVDLTAGRLSTAVFSLFSALPQVKSGKWKVLGYASPKRSPLMPDLPTFAEQGVPDVEMTSWFCVMAPAGTPRAITGRMQEEIARIIHEPAFKEQWFTSRGLDAAGETPEQLSALMKTEIAKWGRVVKAANITLD